MKMKYLAAALLTGLLMSLAVIASAAQAAGPGIQARIIEQQKRIDQGIASGALTRREASVLQTRLDKIKFVESKMRVRSGGGLTLKQRAKLNRILDRNSSLIYKKKHNLAQRY